MSRRGMTLVEMLVAMTATLLLMAAVAQAFAVFGSAITGSRGVLDLDARMRSAAWRLRSDLAGITVRPLPPITPESAQGYLEIIEGPWSDSRDEVTGNPAFATPPIDIGPTDVDDVLLFTTQSADSPFTGRAPTGETFESAVAEVAWFARRTPGTDNPPTYTLYRRQLLVLGYVGVAPFSDTDTNSVDWATAGSSWPAFYNAPYDVSVRRERTGSGSLDRLIPNTLADLSRREARFLHNVNGVVDGSGFPYPFVAHQTPTAPDGLIFAPNTSRAGEDVVLTDVVAFDVRVFDPAVAVREAGSTPLVPGDPAYTTAADIGTGAYVDLGHGASVNSILTAPAIAPRFHDGTARQVAGLAATLSRTYDTWSLAYEANGRNEDNDWVDLNNNGSRDPGEDLVDEAFNGLDDNGDGVIDDPGERETSPPYPYPLRGVEVRIRCYEPSSRQVRQVTVRHTFVPH
jgi:prepilin-type N-terminal cleavage/methylation domain-containing protein